MGLYLPTPNRQKQSEDGKFQNLRYGISSMQGWRSHMEDAHIAQFSIIPDVHIFGVFDGHGGKEVSRFVAKYFVQELLKNESFKKKNYENALYETFLFMDFFMSSLEGKKELSLIKGEEANLGYLTESQAGCTANVALIVGNVLYVANAGDSRCVLSSKGQAVEMSVDHKPQDPKEMERIQKGGGFIVNGRVNGNLNLSRALGDFEFKSNPTLPVDQQLITAVPDITKRTLTMDDEFIVLGCDGIWEVKTNQFIIDFVATRLKKGILLSRIAEELLDTLLAPDSSTGIGCDNMTCIVVSRNLSENQLALLECINVQQLTQNTEEKAVDVVVLNLQHQILAVGLTERVMLFNAKDPTQNKVIKINGKVSSLIVYDVNKQILAIAYRDNERKAHILLGAIETGEKIIVPNCHNDSITRMTFLDSKLMTASRDGFFKVWKEDPIQHKIVLVAQGQATSSIFSIKVLQLQGKPLIAAGCSDGSIEFFTLDDKSQPPKWILANSIQAHNQKGVYSIASVHGLLYSGGFDKSVCITSHIEATPSRVINVSFEESISVVKFFKKPDLIIVGLINGLVKVYKADGFQPQFWSDIHKDVIVNILCLEEEGYLIFLDLLGKISYWKLLQQGNLLMKDANPIIKMEESKA